MFNSWVALAFQTAQLGVEVQSVVALRLMRLARGGTPCVTETGLMLTDKMAALTEANFAAAANVMTGDSHKLAEKILRVYKKRVRANHRRLARR